MSKKKGLKISAKKQFELNIICKSLIGNSVKIVNSNNLNQIGMEGILIFESSNLLYLKIGNSIKKILKSGVVIELKLDSKILQINIDLLQNSLVSRIKKIK